MMAMRCDVSGPVQVPVPVPVPATQVSQFAHISLQRTPTRPPPVSPVSDPAIQAGARAPLRPGHNATSDDVLGSDAAF
jgi:hypothetical protein